MQEHDEVLRPGVAVLDLALVAVLVGAQLGGVEARVRLLDARLGGDGRRARGVRGVAAAAVHLVVASDSRGGRLDLRADAGVSTEVVGGTCMSLISKVMMGCGWNNFYFLLLPEVFDDGESAEFVTD